MRIPSVTQTTAHVLSDEDFEQVENTIREAIAALNSFRQTEGNQLASDLRSRVVGIQDRVVAIAPLEEKTGSLELKKECAKTWMILFKQNALMKTVLSRKSSIIWSA